MFSLSIYRFEDDDITTASEEENEPQGKVFVWCNLHNGF